MRINNGISISKINNNKNNFIRHIIYFNNKNYNIQIIKRQRLAKNSFNSLYIGISVSLRCSQVTLT